MGMQFFAGKLRTNENDQCDSNGVSPRYNFDDFFGAFLSVFIILTGENWNEMMYNAMRCTSQIACLYFITVLVLGNIIMLQLLVAIVLSNFDQSHKNTEKRKIVLAIEQKIDLGKTVDEAIELILGHMLKIEINDDEGEAKVNIQLGKSRVTIHKSKFFVCKTYWKCFFNFQE